jgi:hypothetical protein
MSSHGAPLRLRSMRAELPQQLRVALDADIADFPAPEQLADLTRRLGPLLGSATVAAALPLAALTPKAPLGASAGFKLLMLKWGHTVLLPFAIGAASGTTAWKAGQLALDHDASTNRVTEIANVSPVKAPVGMANSSRANATPLLSSASEELSIVEDPPPVAARSRPSSVPSPRSSPARAAVATGTSLDEPSEIELIERAHRALSQNPALAQKWADEHQRRFPHGTFTQERETLAIEALARQGRMADARARALHFRSRFSGSTYLQRIDSVLRSAQGEAAPR